MTTHGVGARVDSYRPIAVATLEENFKKIEIPS
jgi:hypothetical protein